MKILITCARAPVTIEWIEIFKKANCEIILCDSITCPISACYKNIRFIKTPSPKLNFDLYKKKMISLINSVDLVIPNCEDIFYLSKLKKYTKNTKFFMPEHKLLLELHHKYNFLKYINDNVKTPKTKIIYNKKDIQINDHTILKPVFSRFGKSVIRNITQKNIENIEISQNYPWVQQEKIIGNPICNYAIIEKGNVIAHTAYKPKYLLNNSAATYFEPHYDKRLESFINQFAKDTEYTGQVAFDFIDDGKDLYVLECNPRATSGLHLLRENLQFINKKLIYIPKSTPTPYRVGYTLYLLFGLNALLHGKIKNLHDDYKKAKDVLSPLPWYSQPLSLSFLLIKALIKKSDPTSISTYDIEYDG